MKLSLDEKLIIQQALLGFIAARKAFLRRSDSFAITFNRDIEIAEKLQKLFDTFED